MADKKSFKNRPFNNAHYVSPQGSHRHKCDNCGYIWEHSNFCRGDTKAHTCPNPDCGKQKWYQYSGSDAPIFIWFDTQARELFIHLGAGYIGIVVWVIVYFWCRVK